MCYVPLVCPVPAQISVRACGVQTNRNASSSAGRPRANVQTGSGSWQDTSAKKVCRMLLQERLGSPGRRRARAVPFPPSATARAQASAVPSPLLWHEKNEMGPAHSSKGTWQESTSLAGSLTITWDAIRTETPVVPFHGRQLEARAPLGVPRVCPLSEARATASPLCTVPPLSFVPRALWPSCTEPALRCALLGAAGSLKFGSYLDPHNNARAVVGSPMLKWDNNCEPPLSLLPSPCSLLLSPPSLPLSPFSCLPCPLSLLLLQKWHHNCKPGPLAEPAKSRAATGGHTRVHRHALPPLTCPGRCASGVPLAWRFASAQWRRTRRSGSSTWLPSA